MEQRERGKLDRRGNRVLWEGINAPRGCDGVPTLLARKPAGAVVSLVLCWWFFEVNSKWPILLSTVANLAAVFGLYYLDQSRSAHPTVTMTFSFLDGVVAAVGWGLGSLVLDRLWSYWR